MRAWLVALIVLLSAAKAEAFECADTAAWLTSPVDGATVPPVPTIYVFVPRRSRFLLDEPSSNWFASVKNDVYNAKYTARVVSRSETWAVIELVIDARRGDLVIDLPFQGQAHFRIGPTPNDTARVLGVAYRHEDHSNALWLELAGTAVAYRLSWVDGHSDVIPPRDLQLADLLRDDVLADDANNETYIGWSECDGNNVDLAEIASSYGNANEFALDALFADGSAHRLGVSSAMVGAAGVRAPVELVGASFSDPVVVAAPPTAQAPAEPSDYRILAVAAIGGVAGFSLGWLVWRRRRMQHVPRM